MSDKKLVWRMRRGQIGDNQHKIPPEQCWIIDAIVDDPSGHTGHSHTMFALVVARMNGDNKDLVSLEQKAKLVTAAPMLRDALIEMLKAKPDDGAPKAQAWEALFACGALDDGWGPQK